MITMKCRYIIMSWFIRNIKTISFNKTKDLHITIQGERQPDWWMNGWRWWIYC